MASEDEEREGPGLGNMWESETAQAAILKEAELPRGMFLKGCTKRQTPGQTGKCI